MLKTDLLADVSSISCIQYLSLQRLVDYSLKCISQNILEAKNSDNDVLSIDIGIGTIYIKFSNETLTYKFVASNQLEKQLINAIKYDKSYMIDDIEESLLNKINIAYKELF